jgi:hypothetical protein
LEAIDQLEHLFCLYKFNMGDLSACIQWALDRMQLNQDGGDLDIILLAGATKPEEALPYIKSILLNYRGSSALDDQLAAGKCVSELYKKYLVHSETIQSLMGTFEWLYCHLDHPYWLTMLWRNCEYALDTPAFKRPFEQEFEYIAGLWSSVNTRQEFEMKYDRNISNQHDIK